MIRTKTALNLSGYPAEIIPFLAGADIYDSSCSEEARVYFSDKDQGYFLKEATAGFLKPEYLMHDYFHSLGLTSAVKLYETIGDHDFLVTERVPGEDCTHKQYLADTKRLCETIATNLRMLHEQPIADCPIQDRITGYVRSVLNGYASGKYEYDLFKEIWEFPSDQAAWEAAKEGMRSLERNVLMHGDYCLPNIMLKDWKLSGFIDLINGGVGDRHIDVLWGIWTLKYNIGTAKYTDRFIDVYGRDLIDKEKLRCIAAMEMFGG